MLLPHLSHLRQGKHLLCSSPHRHSQGNSPIPLLHHLPLLLLWLRHHDGLFDPLRPSFCFMDWHWQMRQTYSHKKCSRSVCAEPIVLAESKN
jgi:hypothetical protein